VTLLRFSRGGRQSFFGIAVTLTTGLGAGGFLLANGFVGPLADPVVSIFIVLFAGGILAAAIPTVLLQIVVLSVWQSWRGGFTATILFGSVLLASLLPLAFLMLAPGRSTLPFWLWISGVIALAIATLVARLAGAIRPDLSRSPT
jgi:hypothetical protein